MAFGAYNWLDLKKVLYKLETCFGAGVTQMVE